jgi:hypothetical protein
MVAFGAASVTGRFASTKSEGRTCQEQRTKLLNRASFHSKRICSPEYQSLAQLESVLHRLAQPETAFAISISRFRLPRLRSQCWENATADFQMEGRTI